MGSTHRALSRGALTDVRHRRQEALVLPVQRADHDPRPDLRPAWRTETDHRLHRRDNLGRRVREPSLAAGRSAGPGRVGASRSAGHPVSAGRQPAAHSDRAGRPASDRDSGTQRFARTGDAQPRCLGIGLCDPKGDPNAYAKGLRVASGRARNPVRRPREGPCRALWSGHGAVGDDGGPHHRL